MEKICGIYKITSPSGKIYIGKSINIIHRFSDYKNLQCKKQTKLYNSLKKYGCENHLLEIIHECTVNELSEWEKHYIIKFDSMNNGLNLTQGGDGGGIPSKETREKMSAAMMGNTKWVGRNHKKESKDKMRIARSGKTASDETKEKLRIALIGNTRSLGIKASDETREKMCLAQQKRPNISNETRERMSKVQMNHNTSDNARLQMSLTRKGRPALNKGMKYSEEKKEEMRLKTIATKLLRKESNNLSP